MIEPYAAQRNQSLMGYKRYPVPGTLAYAQMQNKRYMEGNKMPLEPGVKLWLRPEDLEPQTELEILTPHIKVPTEETGFKKDAYEINVKLPDGKERTFTLSETKFRAITMLHGENSDDWVNKKITVNKTPMNFQGKMIDAIIIKVKNG